MKKSIPAVSKLKRSEKRSELKQMRVADFLAAISILRQTHPRDGWLIVISDGSGWGCMSCGVIGKTNLLKHRKRCGAEKHWLAVTELGRAVDGELQLTC